MTWAQLSEAFAVVMTALKDEWNCSAPDYNQAPSEHVERGCDFWCRRLSRNFGEPISPPKEFQPWILARLASAAADALQHDRLADQPCPTALTPEIVAHYL